MDYLKKDGESQLDYILRLVKGKNDKIYDIDYTELFKLGFNVDLSVDESRKRYYSLKMLLPYIETEKLTNITGQDLLDELTIDDNKFKQPISQVSKIALVDAQLEKTGKNKKDGKGKLTINRANPSKDTKNQITDKKEKLKRTRSGKEIGEDDNENSEDEK